MGKNNKKKNKNQYREEFDKPSFAYSEKPQRDSGYKADKTREPRPKPEVEYHPVALLLRDALAEQINTFLNGDITEKAASELFNLGSYPARLTGCDEAEDYEAFQLDRSVRLNRDDPENLNRLSTIIVVQNIATHRPAFLVQAFISPNRTSRIIIHEQDEKGTIYRNTLRWAGNND